MRNRNDNDNGMNGLKNYLLLNTAFFLAALFYFTPSRIPSSFDYDYSSYKNGDFPYGNSSLVAATNLTILLNMVGAVLYLIGEGCRSVCAEAPKPDHQLTLFRNNPISRGPMITQGSTVTVEEIFESGSSEEDSAENKPKLR